MILNFFLKKAMFPPLWRWKHCFFISAQDVRAWCIFIFLKNRLLAKLRNTIPEIRFSGLLLRVKLQHAIPEIRFSGLLLRAKLQHAIPEIPVFRIAFVCEIAACHSGNPIFRIAFVCEIAACHSRNPIFRIAFVCEIKIARGLIKKRYYVQNGFQRNFSIAFQKNALKILSQKRYKTGSKATA